MRDKNENLLSLYEFERPDDVMIGYWQNWIKYFRGIGISHCIGCWETYRQYPDPQKGIYGE